MLAHSILSSGLLKDADEKKIKRVVPKASNKIIDQTVARLYIAYPNPTVWQYTGLSGAILLVDDLVGKSFYLKLVDIEGQRGVLWDQELYIDFKYYQDRTFFHSFELEECLAGLLFADRNEAAHFYKRVTHREKYATKETVNNKAAIPRRVSGPGAETSLSVPPPPPPPTTSGPQAPRVLSGAPVGPRGDLSGIHRRRGQMSVQTYYDDEPPVEWRELYSNLAQMGITEDMIAANTQFIKDFIISQGGPLVGLEPPLPRKYAPKDDRTNPSVEKQNSPSASIRAPPPPPPPPVSNPRPSSEAPPPPSPPNVSEADGPAVEEKGHSSISGFFKGFGAHIIHTNHHNGGSSEESSPQAPSKSQKPAPPSNVPPPRAPAPRTVPPASAAASKTPESCFIKASSPLETPNVASYHQGSPNDTSPSPHFPDSAPEALATAAPPTRRKLPPVYSAIGAKAGVSPTNSTHGVSVSSNSGNSIPSRDGAHSIIPPRAGAPAPLSTQNKVPPVIPSRDKAPPPMPARDGAPPPVPARDGAPPPVPTRGKAPPPIPAREGAPPPIPSRDGVEHPKPSRSKGPPPPPPVRKAAPPPPQRAPAAAPLPERNSTYNRPPAALPEQANHSVPPEPPAIAPAALASSARAPPAAPEPPLSLSTDPPACPAPPPMLPSFGGTIPPAAPPPPPSFMPPSGSGPDNDAPAAVLSNDLLSSITAAGIGSLKKVDKSHLERPSALLQSAKNEATSEGPNSNSAAPMGGPGDLAGALAAALSARKSKVTASDDEETHDDDWD